MLLAAGHESCYFVIVCAERLFFDYWSQPAPVELDKSDAAVESCGYDHAGRQRLPAIQFTKTLSPWTDLANTFTQANWEDRHP